MGGRIRQMRIGHLYAKPEDQKAVANCSIPAPMMKNTLSSVTDSGQKMVKYLDGQVFVCSFLLFDGVSTNDKPPVKAVAYDFSANKASGSFMVRS